jgi:ABC-type Fe3+/spermidine/putrescine transport system ATPase subunit
VSSQQLEKLGDGVVRVPLAFGTIDAKVSPELNGHGEVVVIFRPERCRVTAERPAGTANVWECTVDQSLFLGFCTEYRVQVNGVRLLVRSMERNTFAEHTTAWLSIDPDDVHLVPGG